MDKPHPRSSCCKAEVDNVFSKFHMESDFWPKEGVFLEHASENGTHFKTRKDLRKWCKENECSSAALL